MKLIQTCCSQTKATILFPFLSENAVWKCYKMLKLLLYVTIVLSFPLKTPRKLGFILPLNPQSLKLHLECYRTMHSESQKINSNPIHFMKLGYLELEMLLKAQSCTSLWIPIDVLYVRPFDLVSFRGRNMRKCGAVAVMGSCGSSYLCCEYSFKYPFRRWGWGGEQTEKK